MDVAKYIGLFLHKHQYCYLPNLGNFTISKKPALHSDDAIQAPEYEVNFSFSKGSIDDALANFIAINERISIANAANAIKEFCSHTRQALDSGSEVAIPGFGKFTRVGGQNQFVADKHIEVQARNIPFFKTGTPHVTTPQTESIAEMYEKMQLKEPKTDEEIVIKPPTVNWGKVVLVSLLVLVVLGLLGWAYWYFTKDTPVKQPEAAQSAPAPVETPAPADTTSAPTASTTTPQTVPTSGMINYVINQYPDQASADKRASKLQSYGHTQVRVLAKEGSYLVLYPLNASVDTVKAKDSLRTLFGGNVFITP